MSRRSRSTEGAFTVGGDPQERKLPTINAAISVAVYLTERAEGENQRGVFESGVKRYRVRKDSAATVYVEEVRA